MKTRLIRQDIARGIRYLIDKKQIRNYQIENIVTTESHLASYISRQWRAIAEEWSFDKYGEYTTKYAWTFKDNIYTLTKEFIDHLIQLAFGEGK